MLEDLPAVAVV